MSINIRSITVLNISGIDYHCIFIGITKMYSKVSCKKGYKYFVAYKNDEKVKLLCIMLPKMSVCVFFNKR